MKHHGREINGIACATAAAAALFLLVAVSACSKPVRAVPPLVSASRPASTVADRSIEKIDLRGVKFAHDGSLRSESRPVLDSAVEILKSRPDVTIYVDAYCDPSGGRELNQRLSVERATAIATYLEKHGIPADRLVARGFGASHFIASNATSSGRSQNRRIELVLEPYSA
jgi:outer membrane protein OmpA-like peptidoglycan-associated protein